MLCLCALLVIAAFFARDFVLYDFHLEPSYYTYQRTDQARPEGVASDVWFTYGADRALQYGISDGIRETAIQLYAKTTDSAQAIAASDMEPIRQDFYGNFIAALPAWEWDLDGDGATETVYDFARADLGPHAFDPFPVCSICRRSPLNWRCSTETASRSTGMEHLCPAGRSPSSLTTARCAAARQAMTGGSLSSPQETSAAGLQRQIPRMGILCTGCTMPWKIIHISACAFLRPTCRCFWCWA